MIGFFDSGFGGLTVMKEYLKKYPEFDYIYLGDQANNPYGQLSKERVETLSLKGIDYLVKRGCELIIVACNTASADALRKAQEKYKGTPVILGVIIPTIEEALEKSRFGNIGLIATKSTVESKAYERELMKNINLYQKTDKRGREKAKLYSQACPLLVPLIEEGLIEHPATRMILKKYLRPLKNSNIDSLILGCTHYPLLEKEIKRVVGSQCEVISSSKASALAIEDYFKKHSDLKNKLGKNGKRQFLTTDCPKRFQEIGSRFLGLNIKVDKIEI